MSESRSVTLYLTDDTIEKLNAFAEVTCRSKSQAAETLVLHGIANYDVKAAAPKKVENPRKATAANTKVKKPAAVKAPARGRKPNGSASNVKPAAKKPVAKKLVAKKPVESATAKRRKAAESAKRQAAAA